MFKLVCFVHKILILCRNIATHKRKQRAYGIGVHLWGHLILLFL